MATKNLSSLSKDQYDELTRQLFKIQNHLCFICQEEIDLNLHQTNIDHIIPRAKKGKDSVENFALAHESCNKTKQDANLNIARMLFNLKKIQEKVLKEENRSASVKHILSSYGGSKFDFKYSIEDKKIKYSFSKNGDNTIFSSNIFIDALSGEKNCFFEVPIEYIHHDELINPRGINNSIRKLIKEFEKGNPQLHLGLARIDDGKVKIFDGQHKAVAQILLGQKELPLRIFIDPNLDRLIETNTNAGSLLRQIAFDKSIMRQLNNTLYSERVKKYQIDHGLQEDDLSFSEQQLIEYFKGENIYVKKYITDSIKHSITNSDKNKFKGYIDFEGRAKELPLSYSAYDKTMLSAFIDSKLFLPTPINYRTDEGLNPREIEIEQIVKLLNIIAEELYIGRFNPDLGVYRIEKKIVDGKDKDFNDDHLIAYRMSKEEILANWIKYLQYGIKGYFMMNGKMFEENKVFQHPFDDQLWMNIRNFMINLRELPLWKDRSMASTIFAGKNNYDYWKCIFETGKSPDEAQVMMKPLNYQELMQSTQFQQ